jgi:hypothetical protein
MSTEFKPLFIAGADRSGTTFLGDLMGAHPACLCTPESQFIIKVPEKLLRCNNVPLRSIAPHKICEEIQRSWRFRIWDIKLDTKSLCKQSYANHFSKIVFEIVRSYGRKHHRDLFDVWIDHTPAHIRHTHFLLNIFPNSKIVHMVRDGRAVANSILPLDFGPNTSIAAASWWIKCVAHGLAAECFWGPQRVLRLHYEDLLAEPEGSLKKICHFVGIEYQPKILGGGGFFVPDYTLTQHSLVGRPIDFSRVAAWKNEMKKRDIEIFESIAGDFLGNLGYVCMFEKSAKPIKRFEKGRQFINEWYKANIINKHKFMHRRLKNVHF